MRDGLCEVHLEHQSANVLAHGDLVGETPEPLPSEIDGGDPLSADVLECEPEPISCSVVVSGAAAVPSYQ